MKGVAYMLKRIFSFLLALVCIIGVFAGCSNTQETPTTTEEVIPLNIMQKNDPAQDDELNILMIGNSFCTNYSVELYGMLTAAGYKNVNVCSVYYDGCKLEQHWTWWKSGEANYRFYTTNENGRNYVDSVNLEYCLKQHNWDIISLQEALSNIRKKSNNNAQTHLQQTQTYRTDLLGYLKEQFPQSRHAWHDTWSFQIGYDRNDYKMETVEQQQADRQVMKDFVLATCKEFDLERINSGDAWQIVRQGGYDNLCAQQNKNNGLGDYYHDGDIGGGRYLNACVWFEFITGQSCIGNTYRPDYVLDESLLLTLQEAAHKATELKLSENNQ